MANLFEWLWLAVERQRNRLPVFEGSLDKVRIAAQILGVSRCTVYRSLQAKSENPSKGGRPKIQFDQFDELGLSRLILGFYKRTPPEIPTLNKIHREALLLPGFPQVSLSTLRRLMKKLGFCFKRRNTKMMVYQRLDVVATRHKVLQALVDYRAKRYKIFYQDETWCNANHTREFIWILDNDASELINSASDDKLLEDTKYKGGLKVNDNFLFFHLLIGKNVGIDYSRQIF